MQVDLLAASSLIFAGCSDVILHIAAAQDAARIDVFKLGEDVRRLAADDIHHDIEASAMAHADHAADRAVLGGVVEQFIDERNQHGHAFERKPLGAEIARLNDLLEKVGAQQQLESALRIRPRTNFRAPLQPVLDPLAPTGVGNMHEL